MTCREAQEYLVKWNPKSEVSSGIRSAAGQEQASEPRPGTIEPATEEMFNLRFAASKAFKAKLERLAEVLGVVGVSKNMALLFEKAMDIALDKKDPKKKLERRRKREAKKTAKTERLVVKPRAHEVRDPASARVSSRQREWLLERAGYVCQFVSTDGTRCSERTRLEIDHIHPRGKLGPTELFNLRVLCKPHNQLEAERVYGAEYVRRRIKEHKAARHG